MNSSRITRMAAVLLTVICFFNCAELHEELITFGLNLGLANFPTDWGSYAAAWKLLVDSGKIIFEIRPLRYISISDIVKAAEIEALSMGERRTTIDLAPLHCFKTPDSPRKFVPEETAPDAIINAIIQRRASIYVSALTELRQPAAYDPLNFEPRQPGNERRGLNEMSRFVSISEGVEITQQAHTKTIILIRLTFAMYGYQDESNPIQGANDYFSRLEHS